MATLQQAEAARKAHADDLASAGAHAVGVEPGDEFGHKGFVVVAYAEPGAKVELPETLAAGRSNARVPVVVKRGEKFAPQRAKPESL